MNQSSSILVTGAAGFIGSCMVGFLNQKGFRDIILSDDFTKDGKRKNYQDKQFLSIIDRGELFEWLRRENRKVDFVFHLGARTDTTEFDYSIHEALNVEYSKSVWRFCAEQRVPLVYASSAATYGEGELGYSDSHELVPKLHPMNPYGISKNEFDKWAISQPPEKCPPFWAGLKFFNVYGPNEYHKGRMASVIFHAFNQIARSGKVKLFRSHRPEFKDGEQLRDFIYVKDIITVCFWLMEHAGDPAVSPGLYNLGTGRARSFNDLVTSIFNSLGKEVNIEYVDIPEDIRARYQYFTEADMEKLREAGYTDEFFSLEKGVDDYVRRYLAEPNYY